MNAALGWELRAINMYAHYAANIKGIHRLQLSPMFNTEMTESIEHADIVRKIVQLEEFQLLKEAHTKLLTQLIIWKC